MLCFLFFLAVKKKRKRKEKTLKSLSTEVQKNVGVEENSFGLLVGRDFSHDAVINEKCHILNSPLPAPQRDLESCTRKSENTSTMRRLVSPCV